MKFVVYRAFLQDTCTQSVKEQQAAAECCCAAGPPHAAKAAAAACKPQQWVASIGAASCDLLQLQCRVAAKPHPAWARRSSLPPELPVWSLMRPAPLAGRQRQWTSLCLYAMGKRGAALQSDLATLLQCMRLAGWSVVSMGCPSRPCTIAASDETWFCVQAHPPVVHM